MRRIVAIPILLTVLTPLSVLAQDFVPLVGIPFVDDGEIGGRDGAGLAAYVNSLYTAVIVIAAVLAVLRIVIAGVQYMLSDIVTTKAQAKKNIRNSLLGLVLVVAAVLVLETINPQLTNLSVLNLPGLSGQLNNTPIRVDTNSGGGGRNMRAEESADCSAAGNRPIVYNGRNQNFVCCESADTHERCSSVFPNNTDQTVVATKDFSGNGAGETADAFAEQFEQDNPNTSCSVEQRGSRRDTSQRVTCTSSGSDNAQTVNYRINDPAMPDLGITEPGANHNEPITVVEVIESENMVTVIDAAGRQFDIGCQNIQPRPNGC